MIERRSRVGGWSIAIVGMIAGLIVYTLRYALLPFVFAIVVGFVLDPVVAWSAAHLHGHRWPMAVVLTALLVGGAGFALYWMGNTAFNDLSHLLASLPEMIRHAMDALVGPQGLNAFGSHYTSQQLTSMIMTAGTRLIGSAQVMLALRISFGTIAGLILTLVLIPYFLVSGPRLAKGALWLVPPERRAGVKDLLPELIPLLRRYVTGLVCVVIYTGGMAYIGLGLIGHVKAAALLAVLVGVLELIPVVGPITSLVLIGLSVIQRDMWMVIFLMGYALALRLSIDNLVGPFALGRAVAIHPVVVIFCFVVGAMLFGIFGLVLAVPAAVSIRLVLERYYARPVSAAGRPG